MGQQSGKSEIRESVIRSLTDKVSRRNYDKYLPRITLRRVRGIFDAVVSFDFPVTAIVGPNGGGKTTVLGAAACAYRNVKPRRFFAKSGKYDSMANWMIEYEIIDKKIRPVGEVQRTASFRSERWKRDEFFDRECLIFGVSRTVPANERSELRRCIANNFQVDSDQVSPLSADVAEAVRKVLGKDVRKFNEMTVDARGRISLLAGSTEGGETFSEFHFGAGESSVIRMISEIEAAPNGCLILVEEIENGLHPLATKRMVEYLIDVAERKRAQAIFTTHSDYALEPLPDIAIWAALDGYVEQGKLRISSLRAITGHVESSLIVFVEDEFAKDWVETCLRYYGNVELEAVTVEPLSGSGTATKIHNNRKADPTIDTASVCYIDGDAEQSADEQSMIFKLPGTTPELYVFNRVYDRLEELAAKIANAIHLPVERQSDVVRAVKEVANTNRDAHLLFAQIGAKLGLIAETIVRSAFISLWAQEYPEEVKEIIDPFAALLPMSGPQRLLTEA
ncbi:AAA family ATPase [Streptomyces sp. NPDC126510]|uniref:ATP-dependent nuclease n=1 Tax=Streptomyces sp. NPDC126510 TaxID=3155317 RepID=UPI00331C9D85